MARKRKYLNNKDLLAEFLKSREQGEMTAEFVNMMIKLVDRYSQHPYFRNFTWNEDLKSEALLTVVKTWDRFDPDMQDPPNPFAYYTQIVKRAMHQQNLKEKKQRDIKDEMLVENGMNPSFNYEGSEGKTNNIDGDDE